MENNIDNLRHSCAHLLAAAVLELYPDAKRTIGPPVESGFYYDFDFGDEKVSEDDLKKIEKRMQELVKHWKGFERQDLSKQEALDMFSDNQYKKELIEEFSEVGQTLTAYKSGDFIDLCRGGHCEEPNKELQNFKLLKVAGAYWRGDEKNKMLTRIYGTCFASKQELKDYLFMLEEAKKRDHRKIGKELDLFTFSELVGSGLPLFTPKGTLLREQLNDFSQQLREKVGFQKVWIPHITKKELYERSGHWAKFGGELFLVESQETSDEMVLKPMNCPHHQQIYASQMRSYRDLPIKYLETTTVYRDEKAGELLGLSRVRCITQDDSHIFCTPDQIQQVYGELISIVKEFYGVIGMKLRARLSYRDSATPEKYIGDEDLWKQAQEIILEIARKHELDYYEAEGEAAFYGPKIDFMAVDALGREWQVATPQLDFVQPDRFGIKYTDQDGQEKTPVMIHFALMGSIERFLSVYIEHTAGNFPLWLSPTQVLILPVSTEKHLNGARALADEFKRAGIRVEVDEADETVGKKIRNSAKMKIPYVLVVGEKELSGEDLTVRVRGQEEQETMPKSRFLEKISHEIAEKK
ncbi:threonine--tRNA ligase [Candidatus Nomurabacteria bacterium]|nr:threonine--tRNA ligase [Candidatus Nomurabacteria bacterium]